MQLFGPEFHFRKEDYAVTKAMQDMAYHAAVMPPVRPVWLEDSSLWVLGTNNALRRAIVTTIESLAYQARVCIAQRRGSPHHGRRPACSCFRRP